MEIRMVPEVETWLAGIRDRDPAVAAPRAWHAGCTGLRRYATLQAEEERVTVASQHLRASVEGVQDP